MEIFEHGEHLICLSPRGNPNAILVSSTIQMAKLVKFPRLLAKSSVCILFSLASQTGRNQSNDDETEVQIEVKSLISDQKCTTRRAIPTLLYQF